MTAQEFCYWLQGYYEIHGKGGRLSAEQSRVIHDHLELVFGQKPISGTPFTGTIVVPSSGRIC